MLGVGGVREPNPNDHRPDEQEGGANDPQRPEESGHGDTRTRVLKEILFERCRSALSLGPVGADVTAGVPLRMTENLALAEDA